MGKFFAIAVTLTFGLSFTGNGQISVDLLPPVAFDDAGSTNENTPVTINVVANDIDPLDLLQSGINPTSVDLNVSMGGIQNSNNTSQGNFTVNGSGIVTYTPANNFSGTATLGYTVNDNAGNTSNVATITITVNAAPNVAPVANDDNATTAENTAVTVNVVANDMDSDGTINAATVDLNTTQGGIQNSRSTTDGNYSVNASGVVTYTPANNFSGTTSINYTVNDNEGATSNAATITITVNAAPNVAPVANDDNATTAENTAVTVNVVANDMDSDGTINAATVDLNTTQGGIQNSRSTTDGNYSVNASGVVTYTPANNFSGTTSINYTVNDNEGATSNAATITITVNAAPNVAPVANDDNATTAENTAVTINVIDNDTDSDGTINAASVDLNTTQGGIQNSRSTADGDYSVNSSGVVTYTPANGFSGTASISYTVNDNEGATSNAATITITVTAAPNVAPVANSDNASTTENTAVTINVVANDTDSDGTINAASVDLNTTQGGIQNSRSTADGDYSVNSSGVVTYTPANGFSGTASITYTVNDNEGATSNAATITITVTAAPNVAPVANSDNASTTENTAVTINVVANDSDSDGTINAASVDLNTTQSGIQNSRSTADGDYSVNSSGVVTYTPANGFSGTASITYTVNDNEGATSNAATITITVTAAPNVAPVANSDNASTTENTAVTINVVANDSDSDGTINAASVDLNTTQSGIQNSRSTADGDYSVNSSGVVTYTPANGFSGTASITYTVNDNEGATSNAATITITVTAAPNVAPVANSDNASTTENTAVTINVVANDSDSDGTINAASVDLNTTQSGIQNSRSTADGDYSVNSSGVVTYTPANGFSGTASITYTVNDNEGATSNAATITITVTAAPNVAPVANSDNASTTENTAVTLNVVANDTDSDGTINAATVDLNTSQSGIQNSRSTADGDYSVNASGVVTYTPANGFSGTASISYTVNDNEGATSNAATITITVTAAPNVAPVANSDNASTTENTAVTLNVVANDTDSDGTINAASVDLNTTTGGIQNSRSTADGNYSVNSSGVVTYTPANGFSVTASISYTVNDNEGATSNAATITITVTAAPNVAPVANSDNASTTENTAVTINVVANDTDSDGTINAATVDLNTSQSGIQNSRSTADGDYSVNSSGVVTYTPANGFSGTASISYTVNDNEGATSNAATISIAVSATSNAAPVANNDNGSTAVNTAVTINVIDNDTDSDGTINAATVDLNTSQSGIQNSRSTADGDYSVNSSGVVTYTPANNFSGTASISYTVNDNEGATSNAATISIAVSATSNAAPVANNDNGSTAVNTAVTINVIDNDTDSDGTINAATVDLNTSQSGIQNSRSTADGDYSVNASGVVTYTPANGFSGTASISYTVNDNEGATSNAATISIAVSATSNAAPVANNDNGSTTLNTAVTINVVANDSDSDGTINAATVDLNTSQSGIQNSRSTADGDYSVNASGVVTYTPANGFSGTASISYTVNDNEGATSNAATISIAVSATSNAAPVANNDNGSTTVNTAVTINVVANDTDSDGTINAATVDLNTSQSGIQNSRSTADGDYSVNSSGVVTYTPANNFSGTASISYTVNDNEGATSNAATISIAVSATSNAAPVANNDNGSTTVNTAVTINVVANDTDSDGTVNAASVDLNTAQEGIQNSRSTDQGNYTVNASGVVTYTPTNNFSGTASISYTVNDNEGTTSNTANITIDVRSESTESLDIPNAFTPNGDGANEKWKIVPNNGGEPDQFKDVEIRVFSKRGVLVFEALGLDSWWDGTHNGKVLPADSYFYTIESKVNKVRRKGVVTILR